MLGEGRHGCLSAPLRFLSAARLKYEKFVEKLGSARCGAPRARFSARSHVSERRTGQSPSAAGGTEGPQGDSLCRLSLQTLSADSLVYAPTSDGASRFKETAENKNETTRRREGKACARYAVAQRKRVHAISTLLLSAGSTGSSPHPAPCDVSVGCIQGFVDPRVRHRIGFYCSIRVRFLGTRSTVRVHEPYPC